MALQIYEGQGDSTSDRLSERLKTPRINNRHDIWLWLYLYCVKRIQLPPETCNGLSMREAITYALEDPSSHPLPAAAINAQKDRYLVPVEKLVWITGDERQYCWLLDKLPHVVKGLTAGLVHLTGRDHLIAMLDIWDVDLTEKEHEINVLRARWLEHTAQDRDFEWFKDKKEGAGRCQCAWEWLEKNYLGPRSKRTPTSNYQELLMFFDREKLGHNEQEAIIRKIKQRWNRKQFDERLADKKQCNFMLTKGVIVQLDQLANQHGLKRAQVLEKLIMMESEHDMLLKLG